MTQFLSNKRVAQAACATLTLLIAAFLWVSAARSQSDDDPPPDAVGSQPAATKQVAETTNPLPTLEGLLEQTGMMYKALEPGRKYRVAVETTRGVSMVTIEQMELTWNDIDGTPAKVLYIWRWIADVPTDYKPTEALLNKLNAVNLDYLMGRVNLNQHGLFRCNTMWLRTADKTALENELFMLHADSLTLEKELKPFISEAAQEDAPASAVSSTMSNAPREVHGELQ